MSRPGPVSRTSLNWRCNAQPDLPSARLESPHDGKELNVF